MDHEGETDTRERLSVKTHRKIYVTSLSRNWGRKRRKKCRKEGFRSWHCNVNPMENETEAVLRNPGDQFMHRG